MSWVILLQNVGNPRRQRKIKPILSWKQNNDEDEEVGNYAFMTLEQGDSSSSKSQVPTLTTIDLNNKPCANIAIGLDYEDLNNKRKSVSDKGKSTETEDVPIILKKVESPLFKACEVNFSEEELIIKHDIADKEKEKKNDETTQSSISVETPKANQETKEPVKEIKAKQVKKKKKNRNGKIGINKSNNFAYVADAPRKRCENCGSMNHLTHLCKKTVSNSPEGVCK
ncbi:hypothetical protein AgCh_034108 [Apium graveolens]